MTFPDFLLTVSIAIAVVIGLDALKNRNGDWRKYQPREGIECVAFRSKIDVDVDYYKVVAPSKID